MWEIDGKFTFLIKNMEITGGGKWKDFVDRE